MGLRLVAICMAVAGISSAGAASTCYDTDFSTYGGRLNENMTEAQVVQAMGYQPNKVSLETCGSESKDGAWQCKIEVWGSACHGDLRVYFAKVGDTWIVNNWSADEGLGF